jgi:dipeptidyl aminopeptidase/acylaminoacyl peptidase
MPWEDPGQYVARSPIYSLQHARTPVLIVAPDGDAQANLLYQALRARKVDVVYLRDDGDAAAELTATIAWLSQGAR